MSSVRTREPRAATPLPPRQVATHAFPRIGEREPERFDAATWRLSVEGLVKRPFALDLDDLAALPHEDRTGTIHCVTRWSRPDTTFRGVPLALLLDRAKPRKKARFVRFASGRGHDTTLPLDVAHDTVLLADGLALDGGTPEPLPPEHGGPLRGVCFERYLYKSVKWLRTIELLAEDRLGTWERNAGYHNGADPWKEQRYVARDVDRDALARLLAARDLAGHDLLGADLTGADLAGFRLESASLRNATLRGAHLRGADLRAASLCNADLREADLQQTLIDGVDLDGVDLRGADLRGARGVPASLAAAQLTGDDGLPACRVEGLDWRGVPLEGVLARDVALLREKGVLDPGA